MTKFWRVDALYQQSEEARTHPEHFIFGWGVSKGSLSQTEQQITALRSRIAHDVVNCSTKNNCSVSAIPMKELYKLAIHLPLPRDFTPVGAKLEQWQKWVNDEPLTFNQHFKSPFYRLILDKHYWSANCYKENHELTQGSQQIGTAIEAQINQLKAEAASTIPEGLRNDALDLYVRRPAHTHCAAQPLDEDCKLSDADFREIASTLHVNSRPVSTNLDMAQPTVLEWGNCPGGNFDTDSPHLMISFSAYD
jgi:hypothetical protein